MKLLIRHLDQKPSASFTAHLEKRLQIFTDIRQIDEARATLEHPSEASPAFRVTLHLATPGPDFSAEAVDHTLRAALTKTVLNCWKKSRSARPIAARRIRINLQEHASLLPGAKPRLRY